jgi:hypothetical protein
METLLLTDPVPPPRRYSVNRPGFDPSIGKRVKVLLDGIEQSLVVEYDCALGLVDRFVTDADGQIQLTADRKHARRELLRGEVTIEWKDNP